MVATSGAAHDDRRLPEAAVNEDDERAFTITGGKDVDMKTAEIEAVNPDTGKKLGEVKFNDDHVEAIPPRRIR